MTYAKIIKDSISPDNFRLTTFELKYPRFIHSELMTHRMFSRSARSNRFCSTGKMTDELKWDYVIPEELNLFNDVAGGIWNNARISAINSALALKACGVSKEISNRLLEPFQYIYAVVSATDWSNFFNLRIADDAQPEIKTLATLMKKALDESIPEKLMHGDWHLPYINEHMHINDAIRCSVARCARVSYSPFDSEKADMKKDIDLFDRLLESQHLSPFEHVATPIGYAYVDFSYNYSDPILCEGDWESGTTHVDNAGYFWSSNFIGWIQYRNLVLIPTIN